MTACSEGERMNDRELLELAAKAAGLDGYKYDGRMKGDPLCKEVRDESGRFLRYAIWNPLTDDGAALRLAVELRIGLHWCKSGRVFALADDQIETCESYREDGEAATRRAIVRAAAEIGRAMP